jgi:cell fate regulator YaaT (PSP1 superfamily)
MRQPGDVRACLDARSSISDPEHLMPALIEVTFKGRRREFFRWDGDEIPRVHAPVIVEADRGEDLGRVHSIGELAERRCSGCAHGCGSESPTRKALRVASADDERRAAELRAQDEEARRKAAEKVRVHGLAMKVSDAEWQWDRRKLTFYFTAERRVDFRALVRDLAAIFRTRIELKQIGVRDEAKRLSGIGRCGREYCSASWLPDLRPVNLQIAKDQRLSLNPSQISGACGRLMCCLRYEHDFYVQARKRFPKEGRILVTDRGEEKVIANDIFRERVTLRSSEGDIRVVPIAELGGNLRQAAPLTVDAEEDAVASIADVRDEEVPDESTGAITSSPTATLPQERQARDSTVSDPAPRTGGRRRGRRGGRRNRPGNEGSGKPNKD